MERRKYQEQSREKGSGLDTPQATQNKIVPFFFKKTQIQTA